MRKNRDFWDTVTGKRVSYICILPIIVLINYLSVHLAMYLQIPFFLDTWGTSLGVMVGGLAIGLAGGIIYNLIMMSEWGPSAWVWAFASIWVAFLTNYLFKKGWINIQKPGRLFFSGMLLGLSSAVLNIVILFIAWGGVETYAGVLPTYDAFLEITGSSTISAIGEKIITITIDQIVAIFIAAMVFLLIPGKFILTKILRKKKMVEKNE